jgi:hypothetical protein
MGLLRSAFARVPVCALLLVIAGSPALAACDDDEIAFIALDGSLIRMRSGAVFHVRPRINSTPRYGWRLTTS